MKPSSWMIRILVAGSVFMILCGCLGIAARPHPCQDTKTLLLWTEFYESIGQEDFVQAVSIATRIIKKTPKDPTAYQQRGMVLIQTGQLNEAISDFGKALTLNPKDAFSYSLRGSSYYLLGQYERAVADASKSIEIDPKQWAFYLSRAEAYIILGQLDLAQSDLNQSLKINAECAEAYFQLAFLLHKTGERDKAGSYFAKAEKLQPEILNRGEKIKKITKAAEVLTCHTEQLNVAKEYLYGDTSEDEPQQQPLDSQSENVVKVDIYRVITNPSEVKPGEEFELKTDFMVTDTTTSQNIVPFTLTYSVLEGEDVKIEVPNQYKATRGTRETQIIVLRASRKTGLYTIKVILQYKDKIVGQMTKITVK